MKTKLTLFFALLLCGICLAQNGINYKAVIKDGNGDIIANDLIAVQFTIHESTAVGPVVYQEDHAPSTDANGIITINIGEGNPSSGIFDDIDWASAPHFLNVQINTGTGLVDMGTTEFKAVPYALSAPDTSKWENNGLGIHRLNGNIGIGTNNPIRKFDMLNEDEDVSMFLHSTYDGADPKYGIYNYLTPEGTGTRFGIYNRLDNDNLAANNYGVYNTMSTSGATGNMYGIYSFVSSGGSGSHYAIYGYAYGAGNYGVYGFNSSSDGWAGYFAGRTRVSDILVVGTGAPFGGLTVSSNDLYLRNPNYTTIRARYSGIGTGGEIELYMGNNTQFPSDDQGFRTLELQASETVDTGSQIQMYKPSGQLGISLDADFLGLGRIITQEIEVTGADLAEFFTVTPNGFASEIRPGVLLSLDENNPGDVVMTTEAYDKKIAGIISGANGIRPGLMMGGVLSEVEESLLAPTNEHPIALAGKAYVYANTENGSIKIGDLLTSSSTPGYAMKVNDYERAQGAIIGKAMTALDTTNGFVLVLISLN